MLLAVLTDDVVFLASGETHGDRTTPRSLKNRQIAKS